MPLNASRKPSIEELEQIATTVRANLETLYDADGDPEWSVGMCLEASVILVAALEARGLPAFRYGGYYKDSEDSYSDLVYGRHLYAPLDPEPSYEPSSNWSHW